MPLLIADILARLDVERQIIAHEGETLESDPPVTRLISSDGSHRVITFAHLTPKTADAVIDRELALHKSTDATLEWKVYAHDAPPDLTDRLASRGFQVGPRERVLVLDLANPPPWLRAHSNIRVERVETPAQAHVFKTVAEEIFGGDWSYTTTQLLTALANDSPGHRAYIGFAPADGQPASIGRLYTHPQSWFAGLYGGGTRPPFRHTGIYRAVVAARARDASAAGAKFLLADALPTSAPTLQRMGFIPIAETWPCILTPDP